MSIARGQCVHVGPHRLFLGDCREVLPRLPREATVVTDPPYGIRYESWRSTKHKERVTLMEDDRAPLDTVAGMAECMADGTAIYLCTRFDVMAMWWDAMEAAGIKMKTTIVWDKGNHTAGDLYGDYGNRVEIILFGHRGRHILRRGRDVNLMAIPRPAYQAGGHPTPKPVELMERLILNSTDPGALVVDPFMGSGTTGLAAMRNGRIFVGVERDRRWFALAAGRLRGWYEALRHEGDRP